MITTAEQKTINKALAILNREALTTSFIGSAQQAKDLCQLSIALEEREVFGVMFLNAQHQLISFDILFKGTIDASAVYPREVVKAALLKNAAAVIFTHNHPSGSTEPSESDKTITKQLTCALSLMDVRVLDHVIVAQQGTYSFAENGLI